MSVFRRVALCAALALAAFTPLPAVAAQEPTYHTVQPGENLFRIGLAYGLSWTALVQANGLPSTTVYVGQRLVIPLNGVPAASAASAPEPAPVDSGAQPAPALGPPPSAPDPPLTHTIQPGETLFQIAIRYGTSTAAIAQANGIANANLVFAGQRLTIPGGSPLAPAQPAAPAPISTAYKRIVVDISEQRMYVYEGEALIWNWVVSTGMAGSGTRTGNFHVQSKIPNAYGGNWNIWMPHWLGIYWAGPLENGIHALPILPNGSRLWAGVLGTPISYGCVVLGVTEAEQLYNWAEIGTEVVIRP